MIQILEQIGISLLGVILYLLISIRKYLKLKEARTKVFWQAIWIERRIQIAYTLLLVSIISITVQALPAAAETIKASTGFDVAGNLMSFFSLGFAILGSIDSDMSKK